MLRGIYDGSLGRSNGYRMLRETKFFCEVLVFYTITHQQNIHPPYQLTTYHPFFSAIRLINYCRISSLYILPQYHLIHQRLTLLSCFHSSKDQQYLYSIS